MNQPSTPNDGKNQMLGQKIIKAIIVLIVTTFASGAWSFILVAVDAAYLWYPIGILVIVLAIMTYAYRDRN